MKINEIFYSIQGEGIYLGLAMVFIRVSGCNLRCRWCDTKYAYEEGAELTLVEIFKKIRNYNTKKICITGGEPLAQQDILELLNHLINNGYEIYLETNGSITIQSLPKSDSIMISMDIKCPSSGEEQKMKLSNLELLQSTDQVKFIIADKKDYKYAKNIVQERIQTPSFEIIFTPCTWPGNNKGNDNKNQNDLISLQWLAEQVLKDCLSVRVLPQFQKLIWPTKVRGI